MFSCDERMKAVKLYIQFDLSAAKVIRELSYPRNRHTLTNWYKEYKETNNLRLKPPRKEWTGRIGPFLLAQTRVTSEE